MMNRKPYLSIVIEKELLETIDRKRRKKIMEEERDISRSSFVSDLIQRGIDEYKNEQ